MLQSTTTQAHLTQPQANTVLSQTNALVQISAHHQYRGADGTAHAAAWCSSATTSRALKENSPSDSLNPAVGPHMDLAIRQNLLQGFGVRLNDRSIRIADQHDGVARSVPVAIAGPGGERGESVLGRGGGQRRAEGAAAIAAERRQIPRGHAEGNRRGRAAAGGTAARARPRWRRGGRI